MRKMKTNEEVKVRGKFKEEDIADLNFVELIKSGRVNAFDHIYNKYYEYLERYCFFRVYDKEVAKDLAAEILTKVYLNIQKYNKDYTFNAWLWSIARNHVIDYCRNESKSALNSNTKLRIVKKVYSDEVNTGFISDDQIVSKDIDVYENKDLLKSKREFISGLLKSMTERERLILTHYYFDDMSYDEIASKLDLNLSTMKVTLKRAKEKLRDKITGFAGEVECISDLNFV